MSGERSSRGFSFVGHECWVNDEENEKVQHSATVVSENLQENTMVVEFMGKSLRTVSRDFLFHKFRLDPKDVIWKLGDDDSTVSQYDMDYDEHHENNETDGLDDGIDEVSGHNLLVINGLSKESVKRNVAKVLPKDLAPFAFNVGLFFVFVYERQRIWERRNNGDRQPFTNNYIMEKYFFCNVSQ